MAKPKLSLPDDVISWVEDVTGQPVTRAERIPGGAIREAWFVDVDQPGGTSRPLFVRYSPAPLPERGAFHRLAVEAEVISALADTDVVVSRILAVHPQREAVLAERIPGATWFQRIKDPDEQVRVAQDFIRNLAYLHRLDPSRLSIPSFGPPKTARQHALERLAAIRWRGTAPDGSIDPLLRLSVDWLERHVPDYEGPVVLVQGDTGPGNFMYEAGRVTAVVDWELSHFGDPMDDIAWLSLRTVQDTFTHLPDRLREYEALSGHPIDVERVWYYRLFAESTMATLRPNMGRAAEPSANTAARSAGDIGNLLIYRQLHRRLWLEALTKVMGLPIEAPEPLPPVDPVEWHPLYDGVLASIQTIVPRIADPLASQWTKGVARVVRYLKELDRSGRQCAERERDEIAKLVGHQPATLEEGRAELAEAARLGRVTDEDYVHYHWNKVWFDDHLMRHASGALRHRTWPALI